MRILPTSIAIISTVPQIWDHVMVEPPNLKKKMQIFPQTSQSWKHITTHKKKWLIYFAILPPQKKKTNLPRPASLSTVTSESRVDRWLHNCSPWARGKLRRCWWLAKQRQFVSLESMCFFHFFFPGVLYIWHFTECVNIMYYMYIYTLGIIYIYTYL